MADETRVKTMREMQAEAAAIRTGGQGWECSRCGCRHSEVTNTYGIADGTIRRRRVCRNCGQELYHTSEIVVPPGFKAVAVPRETEEPER